MTIHLVVTGHPSSQKTWLYEKVGRQGMKRLVTTYQASLTRTDGTLYRFAVTRDSANVLFRGQVDRYATGGECPPSHEGNPYYGYIYQAKRNGSCLILADGRDEDGYFLCGLGPVKRRTVLIHAGPSSSLGCFAVAGGRRGWKCFWKELTDAIGGEENPDIRVLVEPRHVNPR